MVKVTIEATENGETKTMVIETAVFMFAALENEKLGKMPGDVRSGFVRDPELLGDFGPKHMTGLLAGTMSQAYRLSNAEHAEKVIRLATIVAEAAHMSGAAEEADFSK